MSYGDSEFSAQKATPTSHQGSWFPIVETLSANPRHGERNEEAQGGAEEEFYRTECDLQDAARKEQGKTRTLWPSARSGPGSLHPSSPWISQRFRVANTGVKPAWQLRNWGSQRSRMLAKCSQIKYLFMFGTWLRYVWLQCSCMSPLVSTDFNS